MPVLTVRAAERPLRAVLAPVNFTEYSVYGLVFAAAVAASLKGRVTVLHVEDGGGPGGNPLFRANLMLGRLPAWIRESLRPGLQVRRGSATEEILKSARSHDLVVLMAHRKSLLKDTVLGTTAESVLRHSPVPVLSVPMPRPGSVWKRWAARAVRRARSRRAPRPESAPEAVSMP